MGGVDRPTERRVADLAVIDGRLVVIIDAATAGAVASLLDTALATRYRLGLPPLPDAHEVHDTARAAHAIAALGGVVPPSVPQLAATAAHAGAWLTTRQAAELLGVTPRAVTKRAAAGKLAARKLGGRWIVHIDPKGEPCRRSAWPLPRQWARRT